MMIQYQLPVVVVFVVIQALYEVTGQCGEPPPLEYASYNGTATSYAEGTVVVFTCDPGYSRNGYPIFTCRITVWATIPGPTLECTPKSCGSPGEPINGQRIGSVFTVGSQVSFSCDDGYELEGDRYRTCLANSAWTGRVPVCNIVECPVLSTPTNGEKRGTERTYGSSVTFSCYLDYKLVGSATRECKGDKTWSGQAASCQEIDCGPYEDVPFTTLNYGGRGTKHGAVLTVTCFPNASFSTGVETVITYCESSETWNPAVPACLAKCGVPDVSNGRVMQGNSDVIIPGTIIPHGEEVRYTCDKGYTTDPMSASEGRCDMGQLSPPPVCIEAACPAEGFQSITVYITVDCPANSGKAVKHGCSGLVTCKEENAAEHNATCSFGDWKGSICTDIHPPAEHSGMPTYGKVLLGLLGSIAFIGAIIGIVVVLKKKKPFKSSGEPVVLMKPGATPNASYGGDKGSDETDRTKPIYKNPNNRKPNSPNQRGQPENEKLSISPV